MSKPDQTPYDPNWHEKYKDMISIPGQAISRLRPGQRVFIGTGCGEPKELVKALTDRASKLADMEIIQLLTLGEAPYAHKELADCFLVNSFFVAENVRGLIQEGLGKYTPISLSDIPRLFSSGQLPLDAALIQVTPPDERGRVSLGISVDIVRSAAENASLVIAQVNPQMPRTLGDSFIDIYDLDILVPADTPIFEATLPESTEVIRKIGERIAALVEDGSTVGFSVGRIPNAVVDFLKEKQDLGIHTEMFTDNIIDLIESSAVTGVKKTLDRGRIVASFCFGTRRLYDYIHNNPLFSFQPTEYVNDPSIIAKQHKMVAINTALEIDLTGQVCADSIGTKFYSGIGGHVDLNSGAARSYGGKAIIALPSTTTDGTTSRIVAKLSPGAGVVTTRGDVHYVVTEYGVAYLHGKSVRERALALISIAHPRFLETLLKEAIEAKYLRKELADVGESFIVAPHEAKTSLLLDDGTKINFRPIHPTDEPKMKDLLYTLSQDALYSRFMTHIRRFPYKQIKDFVYIDHRKEVAIIGVLPEAHGEDIIAVGRYYLDPRTNRAEVAFVVRDVWQDRGIGKFLFKYLTTIAKQHGITGFTAEVLRSNKRMQSVFNNSDLRVRSRLSDDIYSFEMDFD
jgi:acyl-CoA hydrolase/N-acetylglutamate synthase-like GNAT family acetyltransferase